MSDAGTRALMKSTRDPLERIGDEMFTRPLSTPLPPKASDAQASQQRAARPIHGASPNHPADKLAAQLGSVRWRGRLTRPHQIEFKDDMRKRGMPSPDRADALCMAWSRTGSVASSTVGTSPSETLTGDLLEEAR